jgi:hypothetical protein
MWLDESQQAALRQKTVSCMYDEWGRFCAYVPQYIKDECKKNMG